VFIVAYDPEAVALLPTPTNKDRGHRGAAAHGGVMLPEAVALLPTPAARLADRWGQPNAETAHRRMYDEGRRNLEDAVALLPTPTSSNSHGNSFNGRGEPRLPAIAMLLPTPRASEGAKGGPNQRGSSGDLTLSSTVVQLLPTPTATPYGNNQSSSAGAAVRLSLDSLAHAERWGQYADAIGRWEDVIGRSAPAPTERGGRGNPRLSARFVEWLMGCDEGWVCDVPGLSRSQQLHLLGNGVVKQQGAYGVATAIGVPA
jgi:DNA (cytosine-5)-methyltransferase 1